MKSMNNLEPQRLTLVKSLVKSCGEILEKAATEDNTHRLKKNNPSDLVTLYDNKVENILVQGIEREFPKDSFLTEELDRGPVNINSYIWIIDPIDGTTNFVQRHRDYSISIACYKGDFPVFALVYDVMAQELFEAQKGQGAWLNGERMLPLTGMGYLKNSLVDFSVNGIHTMKKHYNVDLVKLSGSIRGHRALGSASLILCHIARGDTDIYISPKLHIWDYAAGNLILQELGGEVLLYPKDDLLHSPRSSRLLIGTNSSMVLEEFKDYLGLNL